MQQRAPEAQRGRRPTVSVVVPCHNYGRFLEDCVRSILAQRGVDVSVLVVDDASTDDSAAVAAALERAHDNVEVHRHDTNRGHIATFNEGVEWARGDYLALISADDLLVEGALARAVSVLEEHPEVGLVYGRSIGFRVSPPTNLVADPRSPVEVVAGREWFARVCQDGENFLASPEAVVRTSLQHQLGGYDPRLPHSSDLELWLRFAVAADVARIHGFHALKRVHVEAMQVRQFGDPLVQLRQREAAFTSALEHYERRFGDAAPLRAMVHRAHARDALWSVLALVRRRTATPAACGALLSYAWHQHSAVAASGRATRPWATLVTAAWLVTTFLGGTRRWSHGWRQARRKARAERQRVAVESAA